MSQTDRDHGCALTPLGILVIIVAVFLYHHFHQSNSGTDKAGYSISECNKADAWLGAVATQESSALSRTSQGGPSQAAMQAFQDIQASQIAKPVPTMAVEIAQVNNTFLTDIIRYMQSSLNYGSPSVSQATLDGDNTAWNNAIKTLESECAR